MRFAYVVALASVVTGTGVFLACSDDPLVTPGPGTSSSSSSTTGSGSSGQQVPGDDDDDTGKEDGGPKRAPDNCLLECTEYQKAAIAKSVPRDGVPAGGVAWATPEGAISEDSNVATVTLEDGQESAALTLTDYKFAIPDDKNTWGITVQLKRQSADAGIRDSAIEVILDTKELSRSKFVAGDWPRKILGTHHYGQEVDTWGTDLSPKNLNVATFGAKVSVKRTPGVTGPVFGKVDSVKIRICYAPKPVAPATECTD